MTDLETKANAMLAELKKHLNAAVDRCAVLASDNSVLQTRLKELEQKIPPEKPE